MSYVAVALLASLLALLLAYLRRHFSYWRRRGVPHEKPILVLGNMKGIGRTMHFRDINQRLYERFKGTAPFVGVYLFLQRAALILDLELVKQILIKDFANFHDRGIFSNVRDDPLTGHLLTLEGEHWRALRSKLSPVFTSGKMKFMFPTVRAVADRLTDACTRLSSDNAGIVELKDVCARFTTDVIGTCAFGIECNSLEDPHAEFRRMGRSIFQRPRHRQIVQAFMLTNPALARRLRMKFFADDVSEFFMGAVRRTVAYRLEHGVKRNDFMDLLIELKAQDEELAREGGGIDLSHGLTLEQMAAQAFIFFVAGFDTSSTTMCLCLYELALNPEVQERLRSEITKTLEQNGGELTYEAMNEMGYLEKVLSETLRKYPLLPHLVRKTIADFVVPQTKQTIEAGTVILLPVTAMHHDPDLYPDPQRFDPERFNEAAIEQRHPCAYLPFGDGPRHCIGMRFAKMQAKIGIVTLLRSFRFSRGGDKTQVPLTFKKTNFLIESEQGVYLKMERI